MWKRYSLVHKNFIFTTFDHDKLAQKCIFIFILQQDMNEKTINGRACIYVCLFNKSIV